MPRIPTANDLQGPQRQGLPGAQRRTAVTAETLAGGQTQQIGELGQSVQQVGGDTSSILTDMQHRENRRKVTEATLDTEQFVQEKTQTGDNAIFQRRGEDALGATTEFNEEYRKRIKDKADELENPVQREEFFQEAEQLRQSTVDAVSRHEAKQEREAFKATKKAEAETAIERAKATHTDPDMLQRYRNKLEQAVGEMAQAQGLPEEARDNLMADNMDSFHKEVTQAKINRDPEKARAYFEDHRDELREGTAAELDKQIEDANRRGRAQATADEIVATGGSKQEQLQRAREIEDPTLRDQVVDRVQARQAERDQLERQREEEASEEAWSVVLDEEKPVEAIPEETWNKLPAKVHENLRSAARKKSGGGKIQTDYGTYYKLRRQATSDDPQARENFAQMNLLRHRGKLGDTEFKELTRLQAEVREGDAGSNGAEAREVPYVRSRQEIVDQTLAGMGFDPDKIDASGDDGEVQRKFARRVDREATQFEQLHGRKPNKQELQEITDRLQVEVVESSQGLTGTGGFVGGLGDSLGYMNPFSGGSKGRAFQVEEIEGVPSEMIDELAYGVKQAGKEVTPERIRQLYRYRVQQGKR